MTQDETHVMLASVSAELRYVLDNQPDAGSDALREFHKRAEALFVDMEAHFQPTDDRMKFWQKVEDRA